MKDANDLVGCLAQANTCSLGFSSPSALAPAQTGTTPPPIVYLRIDAQAINGVEPVTSAIADATYPFRRALYLNTVKGFAAPALATGELELAKCMATFAKLTPLLAANGFLANPGGVRCEDFNEQGRPECGTPVLNANACADNRTIACGDGIT